MNEIDLYVVWGVTAGFAIIRFEFIRGQWGGDNLHLALNGLVFLLIIVAVKYTVYKKLFNA